MKLKYILILSVLFVFAAGVEQTGFANPACPSAGATACGQSQIMCKGSCINPVTLASDVNNCGSCGNVCPAGQQCYSGICTVPASNSLIICSATCVDPSSHANCGTCNNACAANGTCLPNASAPGGYACGCTTAGQSYCGATLGCANLTTDSNNCGKCGTKCTIPGTSCSGGACVCPASAPLNCGGTTGCVNVNTDPKNCGRCANACAAGKACSGGVCAP
jgi:hypothetical protein